MCNFSVLNAHINGNLSNFAIKTYYLMDSKELLSIISDIQASPKECEWVEIKKDNSNPKIIGEYISALSNGAAYMG